MGRVRFPFHVKANGKYYAPGEAVEVADVAAAVSQGAELAEGTETPAEARTEAKTKGRKPRKPE